MRNRFSKLMVLGVFSITLAGAPSGLLAAKSSETQVKYRDLPKPVQETLDRERGKHEVKTIDHVVRDGKDWYRAVVDTKGDDQVIRISDAGKVLSEQETGDVPARKVSPTAVRATPAAEMADEGTPVNFDDLPGAVKTTIGREQRNQKMVRVTTYGHRGTTIYRAVVTDGNRENVIRVLPDGKLYVEVDDTAGGKKEVAYESLPYNPKVALGKELGPDKPGKVWQITREGKTYYQVEIVSGSGTRLVQVTDTGDVIRVDENGNPTPSSKRRAK